MKYYLFFLLPGFLLLLSACHYQTAPDPAGVSDSVAESEITLGGILAETIENLPGENQETTPAQITGHTLITELKSKLVQFKKAGTKHPSDNFMEEWRKQQQEFSLESDSLNEPVLAEWLQLNEDLVRYFGEVCFADELEKIFYNSRSPDIVNDSMIKQVCYTRRYDRIYVNLYSPSTFDFEHTTGGHVRLIQETNYPNVGHVSFKFEVEDKRYVDLFIRIPEWAEFSSVTAKGVKYPVYPGQYTEVATMWQSGDKVEVVLGQRYQAHAKGFAR